MPPHSSDEESPLLNAHPTRSTPIDWSQFFIVLWIQLVEPLNTQVISPFAPQLIRDIGITHGNESQVGYYVGILHSVFYMVQAITVFRWSQVSDHVGRKPILLIGLFGVTVSMICFGLSKTFLGLVMSRVLYSALNANVGVIKGMIAESSDGTNMAQMIAYVPITWAVGGTMGPLIGGMLSHPAKQFPSRFGNGFWKAYPYLLPCMVPAIFAAICWIYAYIFLKETVKSPTSFHYLLHSGNHGPTADGESIAVQTPGSLPGPTPESERPKQLHELLNRKVIIMAVNYGLLSLIDIALRTLQPLIFSTPVAMGGLALPPSSIGKVLSASAFLNGIVQMFFFAKIHNYLGSRGTFILGLFMTLPVILAFPVLSYVAKTQGVGTLLWSVISVQVLFIPGISFSYGAALILISTAAPNRASLGATNGFCQMTISFMRSIGPALFNSLFALSIENQYIGGHFVYYLMTIILGGAMITASLLHRSYTPSI